MIHFTADLHANHFNIIENCNRPFKSIKDMKKEIADNWNSVVGRNDEVYILGDLWFGRSSSDSLGIFLERLNGKKHLILGNHDEMKPFAYLEAGIQSVHTSLWVDGMFLCHDPAWSQMFSKDQVVLCGHVHHLFKQLGNVLNVGVDVWDYRPVRMVDIKFLLENNKNV